VCQGAADGGGLLDDFRRRRRLDDDGSGGDVGVSFYDDISHRSYGWGAAREETAQVALTRGQMKFLAPKIESPTPLTPLLQMRSLFAQRRVITMPRVHHSVVAVDPEQLAADVTE
jgi:hypothetical protein